MHRILRWTPKASRKLSRFSLGADPASERVHALTPKAAKLLPEEVYRRITSIPLIPLVRRNRNELRGLGDTYMGKRRALQKGSSREDDRTVRDRGSQGIGLGAGGVARFVLELGRYGTHLQSSVHTYQRRLDV